MESQRLQTESVPRRVAREHRATPPGEGSPDRAAILRALRDIFAGPAWHGPSVHAALSDVDATVATWRPAPGRNTIWELTLHLAYTRHRVLLRLGERAGRFPHPLRADWWPRMPENSSEDAWRDTLALLDDYQDRLLAAVARATQTTLRRVRPSRRETIGHELLGVAFHDAYHAGQIRLLARLHHTGSPTGAS
jgi:hypothetical protein